MLRTFVAVDLSPLLRSSIDALTARMRKEFPEARLRWSPATNVHLTLKFLGATPDDQVPAILRALESAVHEVEPFPLTPKGIGAFPPRGLPRVVWLGLEGEVDRLRELAEAVEKALNPLGFPRENRPFSPHLTIARAPRSGSDRRIGEILQSLSNLDSLSFRPFPVEKVTLIESRLGTPHSVYLPLGSLKFRGIGIVPSRGT
ncbi:MAG: RNA 2',3'-cyclic phosphodiesterase [Pseudomonadota bacterium]